MARSVLNQVCRGVAACAAGLALAHAAVAGAAAGEHLARAADLADLSLEQLGNIVVTSVARRAEPLASAPASIYVISSEDIRRSGATTLPEALRLAPNLDVARADANQYAISARGFDNVLANKLLVLIDGRTVYTPLFSGVFWEAQDVLLADVERIEVISGPGATLWGANAVNGVINVITKSAADTLGSLAYAGAGNLERGAAVRYGAKAGDTGAWRIYAKYFDRDNTHLPNGTPVRDDSERTQAGLRGDFGTPASGAWTVQGDAYWGDLDQAPSGRAIHGANVLARYTRSFDDGGNLRVQTYYDNTHRDHRQQFVEDLDIFDVEAQYGRLVLDRHQVLVGAGYRYGRDRVTNTPVQAFMPPDRNLEWSNVFVQDDIALAASLTATLGMKLEHNVYTGNEVLPTARLSWRVTPDFFAWTAASRAVRAPSRIDRDFYSPGRAPFFLVGNDTFDSELANVYEVGVRGQPAPALSYSVTLFREDFDRLRSLVPAPGGAHFANGYEGWHEGIEAWSSWRVTPAWRLAGGITAMREHVTLKPGQADVGGLVALGNDPPAWWSIRSYWDLAPAQELDVTVRRTQGRTTLAVPGYTAVDLRYGWRASPHWELSLTAQNLFDRSHFEWQNQAELDRGFFFKIVWTP